MKVNEYIESGILEAYVLGSASEAEARELIKLKQQYPEIQQALFELEVDMERIAQHMAVTPPPGAWLKIEESINELINTPQVEALQIKDYKQKNTHNRDKSNQYISVESENTHMRIHKSWRWVLAAVFVLGKIFLGCAIYFYLENRQAQEQIQELKTELRQVQSAR